MAHENEPHWSRIKKYNWKEHLFGTFIVGFGVEGLWMFLSGTPFISLFGVGILSSVTFLVISNVIFPFGLALITWGAYRLFSRRLGLARTENEQKGNASVLGWQVFLGVVFWIAGFFLVAAGVSGVWPSLAIIGLFTGVGIFAGNAIGKALNRKRLEISDDQAYWKDTFKECLAFFGCGFITGALFQWIAGLTLAPGIGMGFAQFVMMAVAASLIFTAGYLVLYKVADMLVEAFSNSNPVNRQVNISEQQHRQELSQNNGKSTVEVKGLGLYSAAVNLKVTEGGSPEPIQAPPRCYSVVSSFAPRSRSLSSSDDDAGLSYSDFTTSPR